MISLFENVQASRDSESADSNRCAYFSYFKEKRDMATALNYITFSGIMQFMFTSQHRDFDYAKFRKRIGKRARVERTYLHAGV